MGLILGRSIHFLLGHISYVLLPLLSPVRYAFIVLLVVWVDLVVLPFKAGSSGVPMERVVLIRAGASVSASDNSQKAILRLAPGKY